MSDGTQPRSHTQVLGTLPIGRLLVRIAIPSSVALFVTSTYNLVDAVFVGQGVGSHAIGALTLVLPFQMMVMAFGGLIAIGASSVVSRALGAQDRDRAQSAAGTAFTLALAVGLLTTIVGLLLLDDLVRILGASQELFSTTRDYMFVLLFVEPILLINLSTNGLIRAEGQARVAMYTMIAGMLVNIALDPLFIFGFKWGVKGAALATVIGRSGTLILVALYYLRKRSTLRIRLADLLPDFRTLWEILTIGLSAFVRAAGTSFAAALRNNLIVAYGGDTLVSAFGAVFRLIIFLGMPGMGIAQAVQPIAGYNYGAGNMNRVRRSLWVSIGICTLFMTFGFIVTQIFPHLLLRVFSSDRSLVSEGVVIMRISAFLFLTFPAYIIAPSFYQAIGKPGAALILSLARPVLGIVAMIAGANALGAIGVVAADPLAVTIAAALALIYLRSSTKRLCCSGTTTRGLG